MEMEVRVVAGIRDCHVSLPVSLLNTLVGSTDTPLPPLLPLQLLSLSTPPDVICHLSWSGSPSSSSALEIAQEFASCIGLADGTVVRVRALPNVPKASLVTIEPLTEDDWEVVELNAEIAEAAILNQVRIIHEKMKFPLWLHGNRIVTFNVVSMVPDKTVVQLVPGTEVAVAPKRRRNFTDHCKDSGSEPLKGPPQKALLRVQDPEDRLIKERGLRGGTVGVELTSIAMIHPDTAKMSLFESLQVVVLVPRLKSKMNVESSGTNGMRKHLSSSAKVLNGKSLSSEKDSRYAIVRLVFSESAAKGHLILCQSVLRYLRVSFHEWLYVRKYTNTLKNDVPSYSFSPCQFMILSKSKDSQNNTTDVVNDSTILEDNSSPIRSTPDLGVPDQSLQEEFVSAISGGLADTADEEFSSLNAKDRLKGLLNMWAMAQFQAITSMTGVNTSLALGPTTFLGFQLVTIGSSSEKKRTSSITESGDAKMVAQSVNKFLYVLNASDVYSHGEKYSAYELKSGGDHLKLFYVKMSLESSISYDTCKDNVFNRVCSSTVSSLDWMGTAALDVTNRLTLLLSPGSGALFSDHNLPLPGHVLIYGPPGSGKTLLASAVSKSLEENKDILAHIVFISCSTLATEKVSSVRQMLSSYLSEALDNAPSIIVFDDLDSVITFSGDTEGSQMSASVIALSEFIVRIMDEYGEKKRSSCGLGPIAFVACVRSLDSIPLSLTSSGRFDFHIQLPAPSAKERLAILRHEIQNRSLQCSDDVLLDVASKCDGYDAYDLAILVDRSVHAATSRFLPPHVTIEEVNPIINADDFLLARQDFLPVSMRDMTKASEGGHTGWEDVGGLSDVRNAIKEMIELPSRFPDIFAKAPLRLRSNVLLYGPPGCGKTHIVGAVAAASSLRFISIKGPELLNKFIGASEQAVRDVFSKASAAAPCLLFFDEFDSIAPKRGHDNTGVTDRVVNQFLTELDGVEVLTGVFVFAATSRPDLLDAALLRPGRLDRLLFCDFPGPQDRLDILRVLSRKLPLANDVDLEAIASLTDGFSGADLQALLSDAQLAAVQELLDGGYDGKQGKLPVITGALLESVAGKSKPSVSESEKQRLYAVYNQFVDSKTSVAAQTRDAKGKRATLA